MARRGGEEKKRETVSDEGADEGAGGEVPGGAGEADDGRGEVRGLLPAADAEVVVLPLAPAPSTSPRRHLSPRFAVLLFFFLLSSTLRYLDDDSSPSWGLSLSGCGPGDGG